MFCLGKDNQSPVVVVRMSNKQLLSFSLCLFFRQRDSPFDTPTVIQARPRSMPAVTGQSYHHGIKTVARV